MKKLILFTCLSFVIVILGACGDSESSTSKDSNASEEVSNKGKLKAEDYEKLYSDPEKYIGYEVELTGQVFTEPEKDSDGTYIQFWADPENSEKNTLAAVNDPNLKISTNDYVIVKGVVKDKYEGENAFGGTIQAPVILAESIEVSDYISVISPTEKEIVVDKEVNQNELVVTLQKIEFAKNQTRVYLKVKNNTQDNASFYSHSTKLIIGNKQLEEEYFNSEETGLEEIQSEILPGIETEGVIVYPAIELSENTIKLNAEAYSDNYDLDFKPYVFEVPIN
ncbi:MULTISPECIES: DUF4352 domain-containing protein [unclassified Exiguobacterium]|uniref:DUF4352 domain-containing protein n=1 Tax=unclassified Exiguobacterium TaxID=2644629 RepID=UPI001BE688A3|nr:MULTISPECIES: DUF4352 domain-containing protein [unclassified Exiguobacterium]